MKLRHDPAVSAAMAGAFSRANAAQVAGAIGRQPTEGELYIAHFLGPDGAGRMINAVASRPAANAASLFPGAAAANRSIFYDKAGNALSVSAVYEKLTGRFERVRTAQFGPALRGTVEPAATVAPAAAVPPAAVASVTESYAVAQVPPPRKADAQPLFQAMFSDRGGAPVAPVVNSLWGTGKTAAASGRGLDLFSDGAANVRGLFGNG